MRIAAEGPTTAIRNVLKKITRRLLANATGMCDRCKPHRDENARRRPKPDKHKNHRD